MGDKRRTYRIVRKSLFNQLNREFLTFLFFLALSGTFWLLLTLNETYEREFKIPVKVVNIPKNVVLTSDETDTVRVVLRDKGMVLLGYMYGEGLKTIKVNFGSYSKNNTKIVIPSAELQRLAYAQLSASTKIVGSKTDKLEFAYNYGECKKVPVRWNGRVIPEQMYFISHVDYSPDSVTIYAAKEKLDSIQVVYTEHLNYVNFIDTLSINCLLQKTKDVKVIPERVSVTFFTDILAEESIGGIPVVGINMPQGKIIRTFPSKVAVRFVAGVSLIKSLKPSDFKVVVDYNDIADNPSEKCPLKLVSVPHGVSKPKLETNQVDYLIEEQ